MSTSKRGKGTDIIFKGAEQASKPLAPAEYRQNVLRSVISYNRDCGTESLSLSELVHQLRDQSLRENADPVFEPLSFESINAAVTDLVRAHELKVDGRTVVLSKSS